MRTTLDTPNVPLITTEMSLRGDAMIRTLLTGRDRKIASGMLFAFGGTLMNTQLTLF